MAALDVSEVLLDPDLCDAFTVWRRRQVLDSNDRVTMDIIAFPSTAYPEQPFGSVQPKDSAIGGNAIERGSEVQYRGAALDCYTMFRLRGPSLVRGVLTPDAEYQPDVVIWNGDQYVVTLINDFANYGRGYIQAELASMEAIDGPPPEEPEDEDACE